MHKFLDLWIVKRDLAKSHYQISTKYLQNIIITFCPKLLYWIFLHWSTYSSRCSHSSVSFSNTIFQKELWNYSFNLTGEIYIYGLVQQRWSLDFVIYVPKYIVGDPGVLLLCEQLCMSNMDFYIWYWPETNLQCGELFRVPTPGSFSSTPRRLQWIASGPKGTQALFTYCRHPNVFII